MAKQASKTQSKTTLATVAKAVVAGTIAATGATQTPNLQALMGTFASQTPAAVVPGSKIPLPTALPLGCNKRAAAVACYLHACKLLRVSTTCYNAQAATVAALAAIACGIAYCHATKQACKGEVTRKGLVRYINKRAYSLPWWQSFTATGNKWHITSALMPAVTACYNYYGKAATLPQSDTSARFAHLHHAFTTWFIANVHIKG